MTHAPSPRHLLALALIAALSASCSTGGSSGTPSDSADADSEPSPDSGDTLEDATEDTAEEDATQEDTGTDTTADCLQPTAEGLAPGVFLAGGLVSAITQEACTLDNGTESTCYRVEIRGAPADHEVGPFCPTSINDSAEQAGIWIESGEVYDVDGAFITGLAEFYNDDNWQLYDPATGEVFVTDSLEACTGAARPDVDPAYQNHCVECQLDYVDGGITGTFLIPAVPQPRDTASEIGRTGSIGVALNGVRFDPPAPVDAILGAYTIAAFDDCGGHVNLANGYHYHAATGCSSQGAQCDGHAPLIGYALDGYAIYAMTAEGGEEPGDLDPCRGHSDAARGYHYHAASPGENMFIGCFHGHTVGTGDVDPGPGNDPVACDEVPAGRPCCGDGVCDGPETAANCGDDC